MFYIRSTKLGLRVSSKKGKDCKKPRITRTHTHTQIIQTLTLSSEPYLRASRQWAGTGRARVDPAISLAGLARDPSDLVAVRHEHQGTAVEVLDGCALTARG